MKCLIIGNGGREHALVWKISQSKLLSQLFITKGNAGTQKIAKSIDISPVDINRLLDFAITEKIDLTIVGPEATLVKGIVDRFKEKNLLIFGCESKAANLEGSKIFAKELMKQCSVATASYAVFDEPSKAFSYIESISYPVVIKADGLAEGKGVTICEDVNKAKDFINICMIEKKFGGIPQKIVVEEYLVGEEASYICITDGETIIPLASSQDHKQAFDGDKGPNTGGMGAVSPTPVISSEIEKKIINEIIKPVLYGLKEKNINYLGFIYAGLMITDKGPKVLEFNVRAGDPETQPIMKRLKSDLFETMIRCCKGELKDCKLDWDNRPSCCVIMASGGYPSSYEKGKEIKGISSAEKDTDVVVFHAGTILNPDGKILTNGGRVLGVTASGNTMKDAIDKSYDAVSKIKFDGVHYRRDIGFKAIKN